ncbi:hypothetical protein [Flavobacterium cerinum]|uniref:Lysoplasmalogenase n=1 Tax=Flavobacterium cerinum TaxID=2502784 RepID=A0ABY5IRG1_9FLAO|nr:hypothetical protein [Flavobacterium cerinum]UUC45385.1 hypothetical protein NOX80_17385 [Flavobacterium cerinum]
MEPKVKEGINGILILFYFLVGGIAVISEYLEDHFLTYISKPFLMPVLFFLYYLNSGKRNNVFILALFFNWIANIAFVAATKDTVYFGSLFFLLYRIAVVYTLVERITFPKMMPFLIGCIPFFFIYITVANLVNAEIENGVYLFWVNGVFMIFLGGFTLANYILNNNKVNTLLLISTLLFTFIQFIVTINLYYLTILIFRPISLAMFVVAQYLLYKAILSMDHKRMLYNNTFSGV